MTPDAVPVLVEAALRALAAAMVLWAAMRLLRVENVLAQKAAWGLVLAVSLAMPLLMRAPLLPKWAEVRIPSMTWHRESKPLPAVTIVHAVSPAVAVPYSAKPHAVHAKNDIDTLTLAAGDVGPYDAMRYGAMQYGFQPADAAARQVMHLSPPVASKPNWLALGGWIGYLCMAGALLLRLLIGLARSVRLWMRAEPVDPAFESQMPAGVKVRTCEQIGSPVNIGSGIVLPADYACWDDEKLRVVLAHECSHVRQRDFYLQLAAGFYAAVTWFSPLGWWLRRKLSELGEAISDRAGMEAATSPSAYAQMLLEFAALPRPAYTGVAMAHSSNLSERIERLLNDSNFHRAFTGGRRALLVLVPAVLIATMALVHVEAAQALAQPQTAVQSQQSSPASSSNPTSSDSERSGQSHPGDAQVTTDEAIAPPAPPQAPDVQTTPAPQPAPAPKAAPSEDAAPDVTVVAPPMPPVDVVVPMPPMPAIHIEVPRQLFAQGRYAYYSAFGDAYAIVGDPGTKVHYAGDWDGDREADVEKARAQAHGHFLLFRHDDKVYLIDDPTTVAQIEAMQKPMEELGDQMRDLGKQMREQGQQDREAAREAERKAREAQMNIPTPDLTKEMADLNEAVAALKDRQGGTVTREQLAEIQRKIAELQRRLVSSEVKIDFHWDSEAMSKMNSAYSKYGEQMGKLGQQMGELARENNQKIKSIIDQSLKDGRAKQVQ